MFEGLDVPAPIVDLSDLVDALGCPFVLVAGGTLWGSVWRSAAPSVDVEILLDRGQWLVSMALPGTSEFCDSAVWRACLAGEPVSLEVDPLADQVAWMRDALTTMDLGACDLACLLAQREWRALGGLGLGTMPVRQVRAWALIPLALAWGIGMFLAATRGTQGLGHGARPEVIGTFLVFLRRDTEHRGEEAWAWVGFVLTVVFLAMWVALVVSVVRRVRRRDDVSPRRSSESSASPCAMCRSSREITITTNANQDGAVTSMHPLCE